MTTPLTPPDHPQTDSLPPGPRRLSLQQFWARVSLSNLQILVVILLVVGGRLVIDFGQRIVDGQLKIAQQDQLEARIQSLQLEQQRLEADKAYYSSAAYVEAWAHSEGKMVRPGEKIVIPLYGGQPRPRQPQFPAEPAAPLPQWVTWWTLFFDSPPPSGQAEGVSRTP